MTTFTPPIAYDNPPILPNAGGLGTRLFRYFPNRKRYIAVFALSDGTFVQDTASTENGNTSIPYPYNPYDPSAPYSTSYYVDYTRYPTHQEKNVVSQNPYITKVYLGPTTITTAEKTALTNYTAYGTGYGGLIT